LSETTPYLSARAGAHQLPGFDKKIEMT
jgi:hypothetical protein